jgi:acetylornithine deacetylase
MLEEELKSRPAHSLLGRPSLHAATLKGGTAWSTYSASCTLQLERRLLPGETAEGILAEIAAAAAPWPARLVLHRAPFEAGRETAFAALVTDAVAARRGMQPAICGQTPWFDAALLAGAGIETLILGHGGAGAHEREEWAEVESVAMLTLCLQEIAARWCS